ncbi:hypothetical protein [Paraliobacillus zengyii]|uniref:hypothetical protein n=1 Tax=Paraliobacillus zengyii TaxID=2213194 RepID=UPI000DD33306|nr:hypothetical protein [Paraliobacillus zengyii]
MSHIFDKRFNLLFVLLLASIFVIGRLSIHPGMVRNLLFASLFIVIMALTIHYRERIIGLLIIYLVFMGLIRRALIPIAGWSGFDPLLILGPVLTVLLALIMFWEHKKTPLVVRESPDKLMTLLFLIGCFQVVNPLSGGPITGLIASMYILIPWLWYYISFYNFNKDNIRIIVNIIQVTGTIIASYLIYQTFFGLLPFEMAWVEISGYAALYLAEDRVRAIGTFPSAQESVYFVMITFIVAFSRMIVDKNKLLHVLIVIVTLASIIFASSRTIIFFMILASILIIVMTRRNLMSRVVACITSLIGVFLIWLLLPLVNPNWFGIAEPTIEHMIAGLIDPLSEDQTGVGHINRFTDGMMTLFQNPAGHGIASITKAADKVAGSTAMSTEVDISNMIVGLGLGGIIYMIIIGLTIYRVIWLVNYQKSIEMVATLGILVGSLGQWINGGFYLTPIIIWMLIGWIHKEYVNKRGELNASSSS